MDRLIDKIKTLSLRKKIFWLLAIVWMVVIFSFSGQKGDESGGLSHDVCRVIGYVTQYDFYKWTEDAQERYIEKIQYPVRKAAHVTEYLILGIFLTGAWYDKKKKKYIRLGVPGFIGIIYAATDEFHQTFVSDRAGSIIDVLIDTGGLIVGVLIMAGITSAFINYLGD
ncbi:MAG: VanZ family protein [Eubacterium sp.]|nr:VanZ family protein [Eubacterium sp.]